MRAEIIVISGANSAEKSLINEEKVTGTHRKETHGHGHGSCTQPPENKHQSYSSVQKPGSYLIHALGRDSWIQQEQRGPSPAD